MDLEYQTQYDAPPAPDLTIQPGDVLNIQVYSENTTLAAPFNSLTGDAGQTSGKSLSYIVDTEGDIDFPVFGLLRVAGKTTKEIKPIDSPKNIPSLSSLNDNISLFFISHYLKNFNLQLIVNKKSK